MSNGKLFLLDGHSIVYKAFHAMGSLSNSQGEPTGAVYGFLQTFHRILRDYAPSHLAVIFDPPGKSFRNDVFPEYKANRPPQPPELTQQFTTLRTLLDVMKVPVFEIARYEADDVLATMAHWALTQGGDACIVSVDKDMMQCVRPGISILREHRGTIEVLDEKGVLEKMGVTPAQVPAYLGLVGDTSDNIPGVAGIGKKRAVDLLTEFGDLETLLKAAEGKTKPKFWANLADGAEAARKSMDLATVRLDAPVDVTWDALTWELKPTAEYREMLKRLEFRALLEELGGERVEDRTVDYGTVKSVVDLERVVASIRQAGRAAIDTETTGLDPHTDDLVGISLSWRKNQAVYLPIKRDAADGVTLEQARAALGPVLADSEIVWIAHNWRFDYQILLKAGFPVEDARFDTMLAAYLTNPDRASNGLKALALEQLGIQMTEIRELIGKGDDLVTMATVDVEEVSEYACQDADATFQLYEKFSPSLDELNLRTLFEEIEVPLSAVLGRMELEGVRIDRKYFAGLSIESHERLKQLSAEIFEVTGKAFNINSPKQLSQILFEDMGLTPKRKTNTGYSTDVRVLEALKEEYPDHAIPALLLEYRQIEKLRGTYIDALPSLVNPVTGRLHTSFNQTVAATGRLSSSDPNLQNIPVRTEAGRQIRQGFVPRAAGWKLLAADYSQIELRILAHMSGDEGLCSAFNSGEDIHTLTASKVFRVAPAEVSKDMRGHAKAINFGIIYGMTAFRLARDLEISRADAEKFIEDYFAAYRGVQTFIETTLANCRKDGFVTTMKGRRRLIPDINNSNGNTRAQAERIAVNTPIQGTSADMIKLAMIRLDKRIRGEGLKSRMILQVHDELIFDVPEDEVDRLRVIVPEEMSAALPLCVPVKVDVEVGDHWGEI